MMSVFFFIPSLLVRIFSSKIITVYRRINFFIVISQQSVIIPTVSVEAIICIKRISASEVNLFLALSVGTGNPFFLKFSSIFVERTLLMK